MIFATDLDNTMIFSNRRILGLEKEVKCVEFSDGRPITYMTHSSFAKLTQLIRETTVIPITTRSLKQFQRIQIFSELPLAVVDNGGTILQNGKPHAGWEDHIKRILEKYDLNHVLEIFSTLPSLSSLPTTVDEKYVFAKSDQPDLCKEILEHSIDTKYWKISVQRKKIYAIPAEITKGNALRYICNHLIPGNHLVISSGDSNLDIPMLDISDYGLIPSDCDLALSEHTNLIQTGSGIYTSDAILDFVMSHI